ncbi:energy-coupling factor transporter transmembrane protein EcfT [Corynebacterium sp.]|uniref:energy-coupling factor transporter transmembrane component T family protein n=1 Tax=Corynebacterium sp. TaxID=1720 RepID=UPI0026E063CB|nr:energy-coupling factor transporter transmembrane component T [Corynebacterium sp.]MDO5511923.1 energy-coupling factor transporter transmembrane component T [Corynebacterium sp.]
MRTQSRLNPLTALVTGLSAWILVLGINDWRLSLSVIAVALVAGTWRTRNLSVVATTVVLAIPAAVSMLLIHAPYGTEQLAPLLTRDGLATAAQLSVRFTALMASLVAAATFITVPDLAKALQTSPLGPKVAYIVATALQLLPQGRRVVDTVTDAHRVAGRRITPGNAISRAAVPVMTNLLTANVERSLALETAGLDLPGRRTIYRPAPDSPAQRVWRIAVPLGVIACVLI